MTATGNNLTYQWQGSSDGKTWYNQGFTGAKTNQMTITGLKASWNGNKYRCVISDGKNTVYTETVTLTVTEGLKITSQPVNTAGEAGGRAVFKVTATGNNLTYQWQGSSDGKTWYNQGFTGAKTNQMTITGLKASWNGNKYRCVISDGKNTVYTEIVTLTVK